MKRLTRIQLLELLVAGLATGFLLLTSREPVDYRLALQFLVAVFVLDLLDLSMPYGETMAVDSAMVVACFTLAGPATATVVSVAARLAVQIARRGSSQIERAVSLISRRLLALAVCSGVSSLLQQGPGWANEPYTRGLAIGATFVATEILFAQVQAAPRLRERIGQLVVGNLSLQGPLLAAQVSVAVLTVITHGAMGVWGLSVMVLLVMLMRESLALFLAIRQAYRATIEALVAAIEAQDPLRRGHAERVEALARLIALRMGLRGRTLESVGYAALLHDVDMLGLDSDSRGQTVARHAGDTVASVRFLSNVVPVLRVCDGLGAQDVSRDTQCAAAIVAVASDLDDVANSPGSRERDSAVTRVAASVDPEVLGFVRAVAAEVTSEAGV